METLDLAVSDVALLKQRFNNLLKINEALTAETDFETVLALIVQQSSVLLEAERATLYLLDAEKEQLCSHIAQGVDGFCLPIGQGVAGYVAATGQLANVPDVYRDSRFDTSADSQNHFYTRNMLAVPMQNPQGELIGVLQVINKQIEIGPFNLEDEELLIALSSTAAIAIQNARLLKEVAEKQRMQRDVEIAGEIQRSLLSQQIPTIAGLEVAALCAACKEMSGDYYSITDFGNGTAGLLVADVCGKSVPAAFLMALAHNTLRMAIQRRKLPRAVFEEANRWLYNQMGDRYVAATYALIDLKKMIFRVSNAGQPTYPIIVRDGKCLPVVAKGLPLGVTDDISYRQLTRHLQPGDLVLIYSDGVVEALNQTCEMFGFERLHALAIQCEKLPIETVVAKILKEVQEFSSNLEQSDDITIVAFRVPRM